MIKVKFYDKKSLMIECVDRKLLEHIQAVTDGRKVRDRPAILIHYKSSPKLAYFKAHQFEFEHGVLDFIKDVNQRVLNREIAISKIKSQYGKNPLFDYDYRGIYEKPLEHQKVMFNIMAYTDAAAILADPGTCKTGSYLWAIDKRIQKGQIKKALVITLATLKENVLEEMKVQTPHLKGIVLDSKTQANMIINKSYKLARRNIDYDVYIYNYESMFSAEDYLPQNYFDMIILDEAHRIGNPTSRQTKSIISLFDYAKYKFIITATLHANNLTSFFMPFRFLGPDIVPYADWMEFRRRYMYSVDPDGHIWLPSPGSIDEVTRVTGKVSVMFKKEECLDLPPIIYEKVSCEMDAEQKTLYDQMKNNLVAIVEDMCSKCNKKGLCDMSCRESISAKNALVLLTKLRQICCGFYINTRIKFDNDGKEINDSNIITLSKNPKLDLMMNVISCIPRDRKIIIWSTYVRAIEIIRERLCNAFGKNEILTCVGDQKAYQIVQKFKEKAYKIVVAMVSKLGVGQNMQYSNYQIFFNNNYSYIQRDQATGRQHRQGQKEKVTVYDLAYVNSIDDIVLKSILGKRDLATTLSRLSVILQKGGFDPEKDNNSIPFDD